MGTNVIYPGLFIKTFLSIISIFVALIIFSLHIYFKLPFVIGIYGGLVFSFVAFKIISAELFHKKQKTLKTIETKSLSCDVAMAFYNEKPELLIESIESILTQENVTINKVFIVDDGSQSDESILKLRTRFSEIPNVVLLRHETNQGKRHALATCFKQLSSDYTALADSDTILDSHAISNMMKYMTNDISVITANIRALNPTENWLTKLIDARYRNAFTIERAAQSTFKSVLCASGVLSLYRSDILRKNSAEWTNQTFLSRPVQIGDDRRLTSIALRSGGSIIALDAIAYTQVPRKISIFIKQQLRWNKSFIRESILQVLGRQFLWTTWRRNQQSH
jgi:hyaluronan synthase